MFPVDSRGIQAQISTLCKSENNFLFFFFYSEEPNPNWICLKQWISWVILLCLCQFKTPLGQKQLIFTTSCASFCPGHVLDNQRKQPCLPQNKSCQFQLVSPHHSVSLPPATQTQKWFILLDNQFLLSELNYQNEILRILVLHFKISQYYFIARLKRLSHNTSMFSIQHLQ